MADDSTALQPAENAASRRSSPMTNPFSQPAGPSIAPIASWSSTSPSPVPFSSSQSATFVSDTPQFSRKKARHIPVDQQRTAAASMSRNKAIPWSHSHSQYSAPFSSSSSASPSSSSSTSSPKLVGSVRRRQSGGGGGFFKRAAAGADKAHSESSSSGSKYESEKGSFLKAILSPGQQSVLDAVQAGKSVFFTGCAGTGKSFLLNYFKHTLPADTTYFTASTGLAAVNISGQTLHSFAGVGLGDGDPNDLLRRVQVQQHARRRWQTCEILVIDEVSMIDGGLFDKLEYIARTIRKNPLPFGGIQLILTGDFLQLPPVKSGGGFCFESRSWGDSVPVTIELQSVFRQDDSSLVAILNGFRRGIVDNTAAAAMQACINRKFDTSDGIEATELFAMKKQVSAENDERLAKLDTAQEEYAALDKGTATYLEQLTRSCNAVERLVLKEGAQVMLLKNLTSALVNGSRGVVVSFDVQEADDIQPEHRRVSPGGRWPRVKFTNGTEMTMLPERWDVEVSQKSVASRTQVPLMLAWSLTVHKCQGMTLDRVRLHLGSIFEYGQAYVALSRIRSLESLSIKDKFPQHVIRAHPKAIKFYDNLHLQNGHSNNAVPASTQPATRITPAAAAAAPNKLAAIPGSYMDGDADMDMSDELIAMAADHGNEAMEDGDWSSTSHPSSAMVAEREPVSLSSAASSPFIRASSLSALSASQPAFTSPRSTTMLHSTNSTSTPLSSTVPADVKAQPAMTAATVRRHQLLLKRKSQNTAAQTTAPTSPHVTAAADAATGAADHKPPSPSASSHSSKDEEIDLVSDDDEPSPPPPAASAAVEQLQRAASDVAVTSPAHQQPALFSALSTASEKKLSPRTRLTAASSAMFTAQPRPSQHEQREERGRTESAAHKATPSSIPSLQVESRGDQSASPPLHNARCTSHDSTLHAQLDWNKENEPSAVSDMKVEGYESALKRQQSAGVQWLYRCDKGCMFTVRSTT